MSRYEKLGRRVVGSLALGIAVALVNFALDVRFARLGDAPATAILNDLIIGTAAGLFAYLWVSRQASKYARERATEKRMQEAVHQERKRMALELHDTVCQALAAANMHMELAGDSLAPNLDSQEHFHRALQLVRGSITNMRCALWDLYPEELQKVDLKSALEYLVKDLTAGNSLNVQLSLDGIVRRLPPDVEKSLLRISQEALSNVVKHAQAHEVRIELLLEAQQAQLRVKDDGRGFQPELNAGTYGLTSMQDRTKTLGGVWTIESAPGRGTEVHASIPIPPMSN
jgi:signal transduction histidine kinase